jgi:hypothetical protein
MLRAIGIAMKMNELFAEEGGGYVSAHTRCAPADTESVAEMLKIQEGIATRRQRLPDEFDG